MGTLFVSCLDQLGLIHLKLILITELIPFMRVCLITCQRWLYVLGWDFTLQKRKLKKNAATSLWSMDYIKLHSYQGRKKWLEAASQPNLSSAVSVIFPGIEGPPANVRHGPGLGASGRDLLKVRKHVEVRKRKRQVKRNTFSSESVCQITKTYQKIEY